MVTFFASLSALTYGSADFFGGLASRKSPATTVVAWSQGVGFLVALMTAPLMGASSAEFSDILWGIAAGLAGAGGVGFLYRGLASGLASVVSPVAALTGATLPVFFAVFSGERPGLVTWTGIALALPAIILLSTEEDEKKDHVLKSLQYGFLAGVGFSGFFILIAQTGDHSGMWPLVAARAATVPIFLSVTALRRLPLVLEKASRGKAVLAGALDMSANIFYLLATRTGFMVTAVVITALYPAPTVFLQRIVLGEKISKARVFGLILA
ncbi:EamA family transporter, partial [Oceanispirochaeta sp.]|uniref:EamA family transporter n=1 Tax=Oceanispirochaeta sp. TaxID=2035350 RepID=UPI0026135216